MKRRKASGLRVKRYQSDKDPLREVRVFPPKGCGDAIATNEKVFLSVSGSTTVVLDQRQPWRLVTTSSPSRPCFQGCARLWRLSSAGWRHPFWTFYCVFLWSFRDARRFGNVSAGDYHQLVLRMGDRRSCKGSRPCRSDPPQQKFL